MLVFDQIKRNDSALRGLAYFIVAGLAILLGGMWRTQVLHRERYQHSLEAQTYRSIRVPALRGKIMDRNGLVLADNVPQFRLDLYLDELRPEFEIEYQRLRAEFFRERGVDTTVPRFWTRMRQRLKGQRAKIPISRAEITSLQRQARYNVVSNVVTQLGRQLKQPLSIDERTVYRHHLERTALPLPILSNAAPVQVACFVEGLSTNPAVSFEPHPLRNYPYATSAAHILGHLVRDDNPGREEWASGDDTPDYKLPDYRGATGLEAMFDEQLRGIAGLRHVLVNSAGYRQRSFGDDPGQPGQNLILTLDVGIQREAERSLAQTGASVRGAVVVMDPRNGDVLAMVSLPSFNPNWFLGIRDTNTWAEYSNPEMSPLVNRATAGQYPPGSTFKILTALAALETGVLNTQNVHDKWRSLGYYQLGPKSRPIGDLAGPGDFDFRRAFIKSSNPYFIEHGLRAGFRSLVSMGKRFHLGERTGILIGNEQPGDFPDFSDEPHWTSGNVANLTIGQEITVTPIQMAVCVSAVANGGRLYWPRLVDRLEPAESSGRQQRLILRRGQIRDELQIPTEHLNILREAMMDDVADDEGTGNSSRVRGWNVCGKTGTAQMKQGGRVVDHITWFVSFAPFENPRYAIAVVVESGAGGGTTCGPVARRVYEYLQQRERQRTSSGNLAQVQLPGSNRRDGL